jgi:hypothetical protein
LHPVAEPASALDAAGLQRPREPLVTFAHAPDCSIGHCLESSVPSWAARRNCLGPMPRLGPMVKRYRLVSVRRGALNRRELALGKMRLKEMVR